MLVRFDGAPSIGRVAEFNDGKARVDFFESPAEPVAHSQWVPADSLRRCMLTKQTRVFLQDGHNRWRAGRIIEGDGDSYRIRIPDIAVDTEWPEHRLHVRWDKPPKDTLQVLLSGANESARYQDVREPVRRLLAAERAATGSATAIGSSAIRIHAHQINAALRIIRDPIQRYLLADEVGMGKTIQAGLVMRQTLLDSPGRRIGVLVPDALVGQWRAELRDKFLVDDFPTDAGESPVTILGHNQVGRWHEFGDLDMLVVDEVHLLSRTTTPDEPRYARLVELAHATPRLLMLTATPFAKETTSHLALLHLLDPDLFSWDDVDAFERLLESRHALARSVFGLDEEPYPEYPELLQSQFDDILAHVPDDEHLKESMARAMALFGPEGTPPEAVDTEALKFAVATVRAHVSETYRLHHRVIRNRRHQIAQQQLDDAGLLTPFEFTGRKRPVGSRQENDEMNLCNLAITRWASRCADAVVDLGVTPEEYVPVFQVLFSRSNGPVDDLIATLGHRLGTEDATSAALLPHELAALESAPVLPFEAQILNDLRAVRDSGALQAIAECIAQRSPARLRSVVFCGPGSLARALVEELPSHSGAPVLSHLNSQSEEAREEAVRAWIRSGGILVADESGDVGRNMQAAQAAFHLRLPPVPNALEQRIGRIDRYGREGAAKQVVVTDYDAQSVFTAWLLSLVKAFEIFDASVSTLQEVVDDLTTQVWTAVLDQGVEAAEQMRESIVDELTKERRRINELDALESSYGAGGLGQELATSIAAHEDRHEEIEAAFRALLEGVEGFHLAARENPDGSVTFGRDPYAAPLLNERQLGMLLHPPSAATGHFDRWRVQPGRSLFRRGNPFVDAIERLLDVDDRGQASVLWRYNPTGPSDPLPYFGFDFVIEADVSQALALCDDSVDALSIVRRRADSALPPQRHRIWVPATHATAIEDPGFAEYLNKPVSESTGVKSIKGKLNSVLYSVFGNQDTLESTSRASLEVATAHVEQLSGVRQASECAVQQVALETELLRARSNARSQAGTLVADPRALELEIALGEAIQEGVASPIVRMTGARVVIVSRESYADHV
ncbi:protein DpdE [Nocardioides yefusunii]|uniref:Protein DpdE n=1 Tax=Nocardioides yefusunii TaxID=2500546 RepID=A0ABW1R133_9ACTN|nr:protein DpdE [Nocardioides yefusunii]